MRSLIVCLASFSFLVGCATPNDMRQTTPSQILSSKKTVKAVAICLSDEWDITHGGVPASMRETSSGYMVTASCGPGYPCQVADITKSSGNGSKTVTYTKGIGSDDFNAFAQACQ